MNSKDRLFKSCLISAPLGAELGVLPRVLDQASIHWEWAKSNLAYSERLPGDLRKIIRGVDFVLGVFFGSQADANTMFEIGVAVGAGKPVLLVLANESNIPFDLDAFPHVRTSLNDDKVIELHLDLLMRSARRGFRYAVSGQARTTSTFVPPEFSLGQRVQHDSNPANALEAEIVHLVEEAGGRVLLHPRPEGQAHKFVPDLLLWLPTRDAELLNPAVLEVKGYPVTAPELAKIEEQLFGFLQQTGVRTGLIVARDLGGKPAVDFRGSPSLNLFVLDFERFRTLLKTGQLADHLRQERNRAAHGLR